MIYRVGTLTEPDQARATPRGSGKGQSQIAASGSVIAGAENSQAGPDK